MSGNAKQLRESMENFQQVIKTGKPIKENFIVETKFKVTFTTEKGEEVTSEMIDKALIDANLDEYGAFIVESI
jgi:hypothetical protein